MGTKHLYLDYKNGRGRKRVNNAFTTGNPFWGTKQLGNSTGNDFGRPKWVKEPPSFKKHLDFSQKLLTNPIVGRAAPPKGNPLFEIAEAGLYDNRHR